MSWWDDLGKTVAAAGSTIASGATAVGDAVVQGAQTVGNAVIQGAHAVGGAVTGAVDSAADGIEKGVDAAVQWTRDNFGNVAGDIAGFVGGLVKGAVEAGRVVGHFIGNAITAAGGVIGSLIKLDLPGAFAALVRLYTETANDVTSEFDFQLCDSQPVHPVGSVPRLSASAFSIAAIRPPQQPRSRLLYRDEGRRYEFRIVGGVVEFREENSVWAVVKDPSAAGPQIVSHRRRRGPGGEGEIFDAPLFDMVAASAGRVITKEKGNDNFYIMIMDPMFSHFRPGGNGGEAFVEVPSSYFKLDPEVGKLNASASDLTGPIAGDFNHHPAAERFPVFSAVLASQCMDYMVAAMKPRMWHWIDTRPPLKQNGGINLPGLAQILVTELPNIVGLVLRGGLAQKVHLRDVLLAAKQAAQVKEARFPQELYKDKNDDPDLKNYILDVNLDLIPDVPTYNHVRYCRLLLGQPVPGLDVWRRSIDFHRVLDIGVGHAHLHEQYETIYGGELQPVRAESALAAQEPLNAIAYRIFNGPVRDGDGFIDGTANFYLLCQLKKQPEIEVAGGPLGLRDAYGILFADEQSYFSQRWRLLHPSDNDGLQFALIAGLEGDRIENGMDRFRHSRQFDFDLSRYWCPLHEGHIFEHSRMAVARQVVLVNGRIPAADGQRDELYSINFSWASCDRTWRWRKFPSGARCIYYDVSEDRDSPPQITADAGGANTVYPQTVRLREDMTIHLQGARDGVPGRWHQKYLPADQRHVPEFPDETELPKRPASGYTHPWQFVSETAFAAMDRFSHFGVYEAVDSRCQYYEVEWVGDRMPAGTITERDCWQISDAGAFIDTMTFNWDGALDANGDISLANVMRPDKRRVPPTLYQEPLRFRLLDRGELGLIAVLWDKRDDDLTPFTWLPRVVTLKRVPDPRTPDAAPPAPGCVTLRLVRNQLVYRPPQVQECRLGTQTSANGGLARAFIRFRSLQPEVGLAGNIWKVKVGVIDTGGHAVRIFEVQRHGNFHPDPQGANWYVHELTPQELAQVQAGWLKCFDANTGRLAYGATVWFEDAVGHVSTAELTQADE